MLKSIQKFFNPALAEQQEKVNSEMTTQETQPTLAVTQSTAELQAQLATATETMTKQAADLQALTEMVEELSAQVNTNKEALVASEKAQQELVAQAAKARLEMRTEAITKAVGTTKLAEVLAATDLMDDAQFEVIVGAFAASFKAEAETEMFKEVGAGGKADAPEEDAVKRLAAKMAKAIKPA